MQEKTPNNTRTIPVLVLAAGLVIIIIVAIAICGSYPGLFSKQPVSGSAAKAVQIPATSVRIEASPQAYSPMMSSTIGIGLTPNTTGFGIADARYEWNASYGQFLGWNAPEYTITEHGRSAVSNGEKIFWSFDTMPSPSQKPVTVSLTAKDRKTGRILGISRMTLDREQNSTLIRVQKIE